VSTMTLTLIATPDPPEQDPARLRDLLALSRQEYGDLLAAARAALAAEARNMSNPLGWLRDELAPAGLLPPPGATPRDFIPDHDPVW